MMFGNRGRNMVEVIEANLDALLRFAYFRVNDRTEAEDIVYEAVLRLLESRKKSKLDDVKCYLFRIVYNLCQDHWRNRRIVTVPVEMVDVPDNPDDRLDNEEMNRINSLLDGLPPSEAEIIRMNVTDGLSFVEISRVLEIPQSTAKSRFYSGMKKLRQKYFTNNH
jgi:RNA polymerase sigma-70 factor (ECF subfamily)